ncbi:cytochrome P450 [Trametopsis cervina]|nr:cytochrome P450 [Trametopsis cervina]
MSVFEPASYIILLVVGAATLIVWLCMRPANSPPGPPLKPLIGNALDFDPAAPWTTFTKWKSRYGNIVGLRALGNNIVVLNDLKTINDLFDKRSATYSCRPVFTVAKLMGLHDGIPLMPYGPRWRASRRLAHRALAPSAASKYFQVQEQISALLVIDILTDPENLFKLVRMAAGRIMLSLTYGISVDKKDNEYFTQAETTLKLVCASSVPGAYLCDFLPIMKYLPSWVPFQRTAARGKRMVEAFAASPFEKVKVDMGIVQAAGTAPPSLAQDLLLNADESADFIDHEHLVKWTAASMYGAGGETTYSAVLNFIMVMALYPEIQNRAFAEIDSVLGPNRLPTVEDKPNLPYLDAVIKEMMRWMPILPLGVARRATAKDSYNGYTIQEGTIIMPNVWYVASWCRAIAFEPNAKYPPETFNPERFLDSQHPATDPATWAFGICPGKYVGENSVFILVATILHALRISEDPGEPLVPHFATHLVRYPLPFKCRFEVRSKERIEMLRGRSS